MARKKRDPLEAVIEYFETADIVKAQMALTMVQYVLKRRGLTPAPARLRQPKVTMKSRTPSHSEPDRVSGIPF